jgi:hypothetical protein
LLSDGEDGLRGVVGWFGKKLPSLAGLVPCTAAL